DRRHLDNSDISLVELPRDIRTLIEEAPRIRLDGLRHRLHRLFEILSHDPSSWMGAEDHSIPGPEQCRDNGFTVEGDGAIRHCRGIALPCRGVERDLPVRVSTLELLPSPRNGARLVELRPSHVKHAVVAHSIEGLLDPLSGGLPCSEDEVIGLELVRDHRDLLALTVAEMHMSRLGVSKRVKVARRLVDVEDDSKARGIHELV